MCSMNNSTLLPQNEGPLNGPDFMAYSIVLAMITLVAGLMIGFTILALLKATSIPGPVRLFLVNFLLAGLLVAVALMFTAGTSVALINVSSNHPRPRYLCRVYLWALATGASAGLWSLTAFSFSILAIVRFSKKTISVWSAAVVIFILWLVPMALSLYILLPNVYEAQFLHGVACYHDNNNRTIIAQAHSTFLATWTIFGFVTPVIIYSIVPTVCLCYIKKNTVTAGRQYSWGMTKFSLLLLVGGSPIIAVVVIPTISQWALNSSGPIIYITYGSTAISLLPNPIIIIAFLKPVREEAKQIINCYQLSKQARQLKGPSCEGIGTVSKENQLSYQECTE